MKKRGTCLLLTSVISALMMVSCQGSIIKIGYRCFNNPQKLDCKYRQFTGREVVTEELQPGDNLEFFYQVDVKTGTLSIQVVSLNDTILWDSTFVESDTGEVVVEANQEGFYQMIVRGHGTRGGFTLAWSIRSFVLE